MLPYFSELYGNPSSMHSFGGQVASGSGRRREKVAALIASPVEVISPAAARKR
jgi:cysteine desulfurase